MGERTSQLGGRVGGAHALLPRNVRAPQGKVVGNAHQG